jgi:hypothetical protein
MNRKIYELALQAGFSTWVLNPSKETMSDTPELLKKFAELLIQKCAEVANDHDWNLSGNAGEILNHFGVEE